MLRVFTLFLIAFAVLKSQSVTGTFTGQITDASEAVVPGAPRRRSLAARALHADRADCASAGGAAHDI